VKKAKKIDENIIISYNDIVIRYLMAIQEMFAMKAEKDPHYAVCGTCTIRLVRTAYGRAWWFRLVREPLRIGMILMARMYRIDVNGYIVRSEQCRGCVRFLKTALKERSGIFNRLNDIINPVFDRLMEQYLTAQEIQEAKRFARESTQGISEKGGRS